MATQTNGCIEKRTSQQEDDEPEPCVVVAAESVRPLQLSDGGVELAGVIRQGLPLRWSESIVSRRARPEAATPSMASLAPGALVVERMVRPHPRTARAVGIAPRQTRMSRILR
jgi:hypothetical protein